jgi:geranylgeranyl diphosphate synthase type II
MIKIHEGKTGALIVAACLMGVVAAGGDQKAMDVAYEYSKNIGLAFQIVDDILDVTSTSEELGKNIGSDKDSNKTTFMSFFTPEEAQEYARSLTKEAVEVLEGLDGAERLIALAMLLCERKK